MSLGDIQPKVSGVNQGSAMQLIEQKILQVATGPLVTFYNIPQTFSHLHAKACVRVSDASGVINVPIRINTDSGANYNDELYESVNTTIAAGADTGVSQAYLTVMPGSTASANYSGAILLDLPWYTNATFYKSFTAISGTMPNSGANSYMRIAS